MTTPTSDRLRALAARLTGLAARSMRLWLDSGLDPSGGAHGFLDRRYRPIVDDEGAPAGPSGEIRGDQSLVQQARHLYAYTLYAERRCDDPRAAAFAHQLAGHLRSDFERGDVFIHTRARDGRARDRAVMLYCQGFGIFGLVTYGRVFGDADACQRALRHFEVLDAKLHDAKHGGYDQREDDGWLSFVSAPTGTAKCTNTHIHTLETLTALLRAWPRVQLVRQRTLELVRLIATRLRQPAGNLHPFFDLAWRPVGPARVSYGHDVETAWLLLDALDVLLQSGDVPADLLRVAREAATALVGHALRTGWDPAGGLYDHGVPEGGSEPPVVVCRDKVWWAQAEAVPGLHRVYCLTQDEVLLSRLEDAVDFLACSSWDQEFGGYFWSVDSMGRLLGRGDHKGEIWKTPYHDIRACLLTADWITGAG
jgi:mannobiose 2-epimerase